MTGVQTCALPISEFGAAFLCGFAGIQNPNTDALQASYIDGWARVFRQDSRILARAASAAQRAADYIRGKLPTEDPKPLPETESVGLQV